MNILFDSYNEIVSLKKLKDSPYQSNVHPKEQIERLALIMKKEGVTHPIYVTHGTKNICFGHGRKEAALLNGWKEYPIVYQKFKDKEQEYRMVQSDNAIAKWAELDLSKINKDIVDLNFGPDFDIDLLGIKDFQLDAPIYKLRDQGDKIKKLDEKKDLITQCPHCGECFDANKNKPKN